MRKIFACLSLAVFLFACNSETEKTAAATETKTTAPDLPYKASYSSSFSTDVSDADLKTVMDSYKFWADGDMTGLAATMGDSVTVEFSNGDHFSGIKADLMKRWSTSRDSLSSVTIDMEAWQKMYATDKKDGYIITWYKEFDTYKTGKVDSASYHDINQLKDGKIIWYSQFKRPLK